MKLSISPQLRQRIRSVCANDGNRCADGRDRRVNAAFLHPNLFFTNFNSNTPPLRYLSGLIVAVLLSSAGYAQPFPHLQFTYLTDKEGLSNNQVTSITQDNEGFIWFGTDDGLDRFDGYRIRKFNHVPGTENSLVNNNVTSITPDRKGRLWISTQEGLSVYEKTTGQFNNFRHLPTDSTSLINDQQITIYPDDKAVTWIANLSALYEFDSVLQYRKKKVDFEKFIADGKVTDSYHHITEDKEGQLWAFAYHKLYLLDRSTMNVRKKFIPTGEGNLTTLYQDAGRQYWLGFYEKGLMRFDPANGSFTSIELAGNPEKVTSITEWTDLNRFRWLVLGTENGIILLDPVSLKSNNYGFRSRNPDQRPLPGNLVYSVFVDRQNILWIATNGGICYVEPYRQVFELWDILSPTASVHDLVSDYIYSCSENSAGYWISRWQVGQGLFHCDKTGAFIEEIKTVYNGHNAVHLDTREFKPYDLLCRGDSVIWFTTANDLAQYTPSTGQVKLYPAPDKTKENFDLGLRNILPYDDHTWWIRTRNNGLNGIYVFDPAAGKFTRHYPSTEGCTGCPPPKLLDMVLTKQKQIYVTSRTEGLYKYDRRDDRFIPVFKFQGKDALEHSNNFSCIAEDRQSILWIGTSNGLFAFDPGTKKIIRDYSTNELFGGIEISRIFIDEQQNVWLNTERGIFCIEGSSGQIRHLGVSEGLPNNFTDGILQSASDHFIYSGISGFFVRIDPARMLSSRQPPVPAHFTEATLMDTASLFHYTTDGVKQLVLQPGQDRFTVDFAVMNYDIPSANRYFYRLEGVTGGWRHNENGHLAFYGLPPGDYRLDVKGGNSETDDTLNGDFLLIRIRPHWWQTGWFLAACILTASILTFAGVWWRITHIRREAALLQQETAFRQKIAETEMQALRAQMNPHFIFNSLNSIENFMLKNDKEQASDYFGKFASLIRMILESSRNERVPFEKDMEALQGYVELELLRFDHRFIYRTFIDPALLKGEYSVPPLLIQPYVENAIVHGLAQSEREGLQLTVAAVLEDEYLIYTIEDNGIGRTKAGSYKESRAGHNSMGLHITSERISILNHQQQAGAEVVITDLYDEAGEASGTLVRLKLKAV